MPASQTRGQHIEEPRTPVFGGDSGDFIGPASFVRDRTFNFGGGSLAGVIQKSSLARQFAFDSSVIDSSADFRGGSFAGLIKQSSQVRRSALDPLSEQSTMGVLKKSVVSSSSSVLNKFAKPSPADMAPLSRLCPYGLRSPFALNLHAKQAALDLHHLSSFGCVMQLTPKNCHALNGGSVCANGNCISTVTRLIQQFAMLYGLDPSTRSDIVPVHPGVRSTKPLLIHLYPEEVVTFFTGKWREFRPQASPVATLFGGELSEQVKNPLPPRPPPSGLLVVNEWCMHDAMKSGIGYMLYWRHVFAIERWGEQCFLLQSFQDEYHIGHFMKPGQKQFPNAKTFPHKTKKLYGYDGMNPQGVKCTELFKSYSKAYPELSIWEVYRRHCIAYYQKRKKEQPPNDLRRQSLEQMLSCGDDGDVIKENIPMMTEKSETVVVALNPGRYITLKDVARMQSNGTKIKHYTSYNNFWKSRHPSLSGSGMRCTALASVQNEA